MSTLRVVRISALIASLLAMVVAVPASAEWSQPFTVSDADSRNPGVGMDTKGNAVFKWERFDGTNWRVQARRRSGSGILRFTGNVSWGGDPGQDSSESQIAVRPIDGTAFFIWRRVNNQGQQQVFGRMRSPADQLGAHWSLGEDPPNGPLPHVDRFGAFTWIQANRVVEGSISNPAASLVSNNTGAVSDPQVVVDGNLSRIFAWLFFDGTNFRVQSRARVGSQWERTKTLSGAGGDATAPRLAADPLGNTIVVWTGFDGMNWRVRTRTRSAVGVWTDVENLSFFGEDAFDPQVAVDASGTAVFTWTRFNGTHDRVQARTRSAVGVLSAVQNLSSLGLDASAPQVAVDDDGNTVFAWVLNDGTNNRVQVRSRSAAGVLGDVETLSASGQEAVAARIAVNPGGNAVVVYQNSLGQILGHVGP
jgi:hypothetical protein